MTEPIAGNNGGERLKRLRERAGLRQRDVARHLGWSVTSYQHYENRWKKRYLPPDFVERVTDVFTRAGIDMESVRSLYRPESDQASLPEPYDLIPIYEGSVQRGGGEVDERGTVIEQMPINTRLYATATQGEPAYAFGLLFDSDTMQPTVHAGDVVICDGSVDEINGDGLYCIREHGQVTIRRIRNNPYSGKIDLLFDNDRYGAIEGVAPAQVEVAGKVVWVISRP